jgi:transposase
LNDGLCGNFNAESKAMNKERRARLVDLRERLTAIKAELEEVKDGEQDALDNMPESLQEGERGQVMSGNVEIMYDVIDYLDQSDESLSSLIDA